jgi:hypothetical protein
VTFPATRRLLVPDPPDDLEKKVTLSKWADTGTRVFRCHPAGIDACSFNPGPGGAGRFHWFQDAAGISVPILYAAETVDAALAETIFRDVPVTGRKFVPAHRLVGRSLTELVVDPLRPPLQLVELHDPGLFRLNVRPRQLTATTSFHYTRTAAWACAIHRQVAWAQGLVWMSGRLNTSRCLVLFGDRTSPASLRQVSPPLPLYEGDGARALIDLGRRLGITVAHPTLNPDGGI